MNEVIVSMEDISKTFPGVKALDHVRFELRSGEVMALLGENGAGKSTLMKILSGVYTRDSGKVEVFGKEYGDFTPKQAQQAGVAIIHQELNMCRHLSVAENMFLGREKSGRFCLKNAEMEAEAKRILDELGVDINPKQTVGDLPVSKQQMIEIAKALSINAKILIMDEPTSALTSKEIEELFRIIRQLKSQGCGIVYISHRLEELQHITDRVTIMRDGQYICSGQFKNMTMDEIIANMVGREIKEKFPRVECQKGKKIFEVKNLNAGKLVRNINFSLYEGEIVGFAGLMGAGRTETTRAIFGVDKKETGEIYLDGAETKICGNRGIAFLREQPAQTMLFYDMSYMDNLCMTMDHRVKNVWRNPKVRKCIQADLKKLLNKGIAVVILAVNMADALSLADRVVRIDKKTSVTEYERKNFGMLPVNIPWKALYDDKFLQLFQDNEIVF